MRTQVSLGPDPAASLSCSPRTRLRDGALFCMHQKSQFDPCSKSSGDRNPPSPTLEILSRGALTQHDKFIAAARQWKGGLWAAGLLQLWTISECFIIMPDVTRDAGGNIPEFPGQPLGWQDVSRSQAGFCLASGLCSPGLSTLASSCPKSSSLF